MLALGTMVCEGPVGLAKKREAVLFQCAREACGPIHLLTPLGDICSGGLEHGNAVSTLLFGHIACRVGRAEDFGTAATVLCDGDPADADCDGENLVVPGKSEFSDGAEQIRSDQLRALDRTSIQQQPKLVASQAGEGSGLAYLR